MEVLGSTLNSAGPVATLIAPGKKSKQVAGDALKFDVLIVDEATQATEPSLMIPLCLLKRNV